MKEKCKYLNQEQENAIAWIKNNAMVHNFDVDSYNVTLGKKCIATVRWNRVVAKISRGGDILSAKQIARSFAPPPESWSQSQKRSWYEAERKQLASSKPVRFARYDPKQKRFKSIRY